MDFSKCAIVLMAGGSGERFWPMSRSSRPKHLLPIVGERSMLAQTVERALTLVPLERIVVVTHRDQKAGVLADCPQLLPQNVIAEPARCNTAAVVGLSALWVKKHLGNGGVFSVWPADAAIEDAQAFTRRMREALTVATRSRCWTLLGVSPTYAATGYGYIERGEVLDGDVQAYKVARFVEKPDVATAKRYLESGDFYWNAGIFSVLADVALAGIRKHLPALADALGQLEAEWKFEIRLESILEKYYAIFPKISIDCGVIERTDNVSVLPATFAWDDVGEWTALSRHYPHDADGNCVRGEAVLHASENAVAFNDVSGHTIALCGVKDLVVVHTADATLVCHKNAVQSLKELLRNVPERLL